MADTLITVTQRVARRVGLDSTFTSFSDDDETNDLVTYINDALLEILDALPDDTPYLVNIDGDFTTVASTRLYAMESGARPFNILEWSFENETLSDAPLEIASPEYLNSIDPKWDETEGIPLYVYLEGSQIGVYPVPDAAYTINYRYKTAFSALSATSATFPIPDEWIRQFIEVRAEGIYKTNKGFKEAEEKMLQADRALIGIQADVWVMNPTYATPEGYGNA